MFSGAGRLPIHQICVKGGETIKTSMLLSSALCLFLCSCRYAREVGSNSTPSCSRSTNTASGMKHIIVYEEPAKFCRWPANNGAWSWSNEILVCFDLHYLKEPDRSVDPTEHHVDWEKPGEIVMARSIDCRQSSRLEKPAAFSAHQLNKKAVTSPGQLDFPHPDFAMRLRNTQFHISYDRGRTWKDLTNFQTLVSS